MQVCIIGAGYVGLVTAACFAQLGHTVCCVEKSEQKLKMLLENKIPIYEPGLEELVIKNRNKNQLSFTNDINVGLADASIVFIAVGTPQDEDGSADLSYVLSAAKEIGETIHQDILVVNKSTVPVGTGQKVYNVISEQLKIRKKTDLEFDVASNPEFLKEGDAIDDFFRPDRIVLGVRQEKSEKILKNLYAHFVKNGNPILVMDILSAELTKYAANAMLATRISFMNEISKLCDTVGADIEFIRRGIGTDKRIGMPFLYAGLGYGGSCFPKDVKALQKTMHDHELSCDLMTAVDKVNQEQAKYFFNKISNYFDHDFSSKSFSFWGLSFKPNTDDVRESQSVKLIKMLCEKGAKIRVHDPESLKHLSQVIEHTNVTGYEDKYEALHQTDALVLATEWSEYRNPEFQKMEKLLKNKIIFDGRNQYNPTELRTSGWNYICLGR